MIRYELLDKIGQGSYGDVYKCYDHQNNAIVAMKRIPFYDILIGVPCEILREISVLKELDHGNVVRLLDVMCEQDRCYLYFEYLHHDLNKFIKDHSRSEINRNVIKSFLFQILQGVSYCHSQNVVHRDLKPHNLLLDLDCRTVKLADFGFARTFDVPLPEYSREVTTLAYRAPELLLGTPYSNAVDIWSVGCIFAEMVKRKVLFNGFCNASMMLQIIRMFGLPDETDWPGLKAACLELLPMEMLPSEPVVQLKDHFPGLEAEGVDLLSRMLCVNPIRRITALDALQHQYFRDVRVINH